MTRPIRPDQETFYSCDYTHEQCAPPVRIFATGVMRWVRGNMCSQQGRRFLSLTMVTSGDLRVVESGGMTHTASRGAVVLAHPGKDQQLHTGLLGTCTRRGLMIEGPLLCSWLEYLTLGEHRIIVPRTPSALIDDFRRAHAVMKEKNGDYIGELSEICHRVLLELGRAVRSPVPPDMRATIEYINRTAVRRALSLQEIAAHLHVTPRHCTRLFVRHTGMTPVQFCIHQRISSAKVLLQSSSMRIKEIAVRLGYNEPAWFCTQFKKACGCSPQEFRSQVNRIL